MALQRGCWGGLFIAERMKDFRTSRMDAARVKGRARDGASRTVREKS